MADALESFKFLSLPLEVRRKAYECLFTPATVFIVIEQYNSTSAERAPQIWSVVEDHARSGQLLSTCFDIFYEARPIFFRDLTFHVERDGLIPGYWTNDQQQWCYAEHIRNMCIDVNNCDVYNFRDNIRDYWVIKGSLTRLELNCAAPEWRAPLLSIDWGDLEARPTFEEAFEVMSTIAMLFMLSSKLNKMTNASICGRKVRYVLEQSNDLKDGQNLLCDDIREV